MQHTAVGMTPTLRPTSPEPPRRQGNYAFRWFTTRARHWPEFLDLCTAAWPDFESAYDSQIVGLWRAAPDEGDTVRSLLVTRRKLSRRYDLCDDTVVYTSTLLTANDREDTARWT